MADYLILGLLFLAGISTGLLLERRLRRRPQNYVPRTSSVEGDPPKPRK
jgi:hypothetical protein